MTFLVFWFTYSNLVISTYFKSPYMEMHIAAQKKKAPNIHMFSILWNLIKQLFHSNLLDTRLVIANYIGQFQISCWLTPWIVSTQFHCHHLVPGSDHYILLSCCHIFYQIREENLVMYHSKYFHLTKLLDNLLTF